MGNAVKSTKDGAGQRDVVGSLERGLGVIEVLTRHPDGMTLSEMADAAGLTRAGARRFLLTLVSTGHARQDGRRFLLTPKLLSQMRVWVERMSLWDFAQPFMRDVAAALNESCSAAVLADTDVVYVARVPGERIISVALHVGTRLPAYCTSMGRVLLAGLPENERREMISRSRLVANTERTITDPDRLLAVLEDVAASGYSMVDGELELGLRSLAVPIHDRSGRVVAAINVPTQAARHTPGEIEREFLPVLRGAATRIEDFFVVQ